MSDNASVQPYFELLNRQFLKRNDILESANRLVDYSYSLQSSNDAELGTIRASILKEMNLIVSSVSELAPVLNNPQIIATISNLVVILNEGLDLVDSEGELKDFVASRIRNDFCPLVQMTQLKLNPKSIKKAFGIEVGVKDVIKLKGMFEHYQDNY